MMGRTPGAKNKPKDYQMPMGDQLRQSDAMPIAEPIIEDQAKRFDQPQVWGRVKYMGDVYEITNFYGARFTRGEWVEVSDPFIWKKTSTNGDFDVEGRDETNAARAKMRAQRELDRLE